MNYYPYNSRNSLYRSKIGAVASEEELTLRLLLHKDACADKVYLCIKKDGEELISYEMTAADMLEDYIFFDKTLSFDEGIYWYYFRYTSRYGDFFVVKENNGNGVVSREMTACFQQTVYSKDYRTPERFNGGIIYQIFPDRFYNSGKEKSNVPNDRIIRKDWGGLPFYRQDGSAETLGNDYFGGDFSGIAEKMPYLKSLGVSVIYLNPIFEAHSNHRYNTANYMKPDPLLGTKEDFKALCRTAHENGISIILDGVFSHTGADSIYFDKYNRYETLGAYESEGSPYREWYDFGETRDQYRSWWGVESLPETNETNEKYIDFICGDSGVLRYWMSLGADGWRLDVADELPDLFLEKLRSTVKSENPDALILGEVWEDATNKISYGHRRKYLLGNQLDSVMNYPFSNGIIEFIRFGNAEKLCNTVCEICENYPKPALNLLMNHIGTHDTARVLSVLAGKADNCGNREQQANSSLTLEETELAVKMLKAAAVIQYTLVGIPSLYYGDEAGTDGLFDPFCRKCYPWGSENGDLLSFYRNLGMLRRSLTPLKSGDFEPFVADGGMFAFIRKDGESAVLTAVNTSDLEKEFCLPEGFKTVFGETAESSVVRLKKYGYTIAKK